MKRQQLIKYIVANGALILREGSHHTIYYNKATNQISAVGRPQRAGWLTLSKN